MLEFIAGLLIVMRLLDCEFRRAGRIHSPSARSGDRAGTDPSHPGTTCTEWGGLWNAHGPKLGGFKC